MSKKIEWTNQIPAEPGLYWVKKWRRNGHPEFEHWEAVTVCSLYDCCGHPSIAWLGTDWDTNPEDISEKTLWSVEPVEVPEDPIKERT